MHMHWSDVMYIVSLCLFFPLCFAHAARPSLPVKYSTTESSITLMWTTNVSCFEAEVSSFTIMWSETNGASVSDTVEDVTSYTLTELKPGTTYEIRVFAQSTSEVLSSSVLYVQTESDSTVPTNGPGVYVCVTLASCLHFCTYYSVMICISMFVFSSNCTLNLYGAQRYMIINMHAYNTHTHTHTLCIHAACAHTQIHAHVHTAQF